MAITLEVKVYEKDEPSPARIEVTGLTSTLTTNNVNQAVVLIKTDIERILAGPPKKD